MKRIWTIVAMALVLGGCRKPEKLTEETARLLVKEKLVRSEPIYAEVPQKVWYGPKAPKDDYDGKAVATLMKLQQAGLVTVSHSVEPDGTETWIAKATQKGFPILGTMPSARGPVYRGHIAMKKYDGLENFIQHPNDRTVARGEIVWHYEKPTPLYELFDTKIDKPIGVPFKSLASFHWKDYQWRVNVIVKKERA